MRDARPKSPILLAAVTLIAAVLLRQTLTAQTVFTWTGGDILTGSITPTGLTTLNAGDTLNITTSADHDFNGRSVVNNGTINWVQGHLRSGNNGSITNNAQWNDSSTNQQFNNAYGGGVMVFVNAAGGTYTKTGGQTNFFVPFNNSGALILNSGSINLQGGGTFSGAGSATAAADTTVYFNSGYTVPDGSKLAGAGDFVLSGGSLDLAGIVNAAGFKLQSGTLTNSQTFNNTVPWLATNLNTSGTTTVGTNGVFSIVGANDHDFNGRHIVNNGTVNWQQGHLRSGNGGTITNNGQWNDASTNHQLNNAYGGTILTFSNSALGTYEKIGSGQTNFYVPFFNSGAVVLTTGTLNLEGGGSFAGTATVNAATGTTLYFNSNYSLASGTSLQGAGSYQLVSGTLTITGTVNVNNFVLAGGTLAGNQTFNGGVTWTNSSLNSGGTTTNGAGSTLVISGANDHNFDGRGLVNLGTINWQQGHLRSGNGGSITNSGQWNDSSVDRQFNNAYGGTVSTFTNSTNGTYTKTAAGQTNFYVPFFNNGAIALNSGTFNLQGGGGFSSTGTVNAAAGTTFFFNSDYSLASGVTLLGAGSYQLNSGTLSITGTLNATNLSLAGGVLAGNHTLAAGTTWTNASLNSGGTTTNGVGATFVITGANDHNFDGRNLVNNGTVNWQQGYLRSGNSGSITNHAQWNDSTSGQQLNNAYGGTVMNFTNSANGTYTKTGGQTNFHVPFHNHGAVILTAGSLNLAGGGGFSGSATVTAAADTVIYFNSDYALASGVSLQGAGSYTLVGGTLATTGTINVSNLQLAGGALAGDHTLAGNVTWTTSSLNTGGTTTIAAGSGFTITGGNDHDFNGRHIVNNGTVSWQQGHLRSGNGGTITNNAQWNDASIDRQFNNAYGGGVLVFTNSSGAVYRKTGSGTTSVFTNLVNNGQLDLQAGVLALHGSTSFGSGASSIGAGLLQLVAGTFSTVGANSFSNLDLIGGVFNAGGTNTFANFRVLGGTVTGNHTLAGNVRWSGGNFSNGNTTTISGAFEIASSADHDFDAHQFINTGVVNWTGGHLRSGNGGTILNSGVWNDSAGFDINNAYGGTVLTFSNNGTYHKSGTGTSRLLVPFISNGGAILVAGGTLQFAGGFQHNGGAIAVSNGSTVQFDQGLTLASGSLSGSGNVAANVTSSGVISPGASAGQLNVTGSLTLLATSSLLIELGGTTQASGYDFLSVAGTGTLGGTLAIVFANGFQSSVQSTNTFTVLTAGAPLTGSFANGTSGQRVLTADGFGSFQVNYGTGSSFSPNSVVLSNFVAVPEPSTWALLLAGGLLVAWQIRRRG